MWGQSRQAHGFSDVLGHCLSLSAFLMGAHKQKKSSLHISHHGKDFPYIQQKLVVGDSKQTVEIMKIRMKMVKELAVKIEGENECKSYYREHHTACTTLFSIIFVLFILFTPSKTPRERQCTIITNREVKQVPQITQPGRSDPPPLPVPCLAPSYRGRASHGSCGGWRCRSLEGQCG